MTTKSRKRALRLRLSGLGLAVGIAGVIALSFAQFDGAFTPTTTVTVSAPRAGLVLDPDAKVKLRGVEVGRVARIDTAGHTAELTLALQPDKLALIPANVDVDIESTTVFGAKYVNLTLPHAASPTHLAAGAQLATDRVTVEYNTLFEHLTDLLGKIAPQRINATLAALATALHGRGSDLGELLTDADSYLTRVNPTLPVLRTDLDKAADVANIYADAAPDLVRTVGNVTTTSNSIVDEQDQLNRVLLSVIGLNDTGNVGAVLRDNRADLGTVLGELRNPSALLDRFAPVLNCLIIGLDRLQPTVNYVFGGGQEGIALNSGFMYGAKPYTAPGDLPKVHATGAPSCWGLPAVQLGPQYPFAKYLVDDTAQVPYAPSTRLDPNGPNIFQLLYGNTYNGKPIDQPVRSPRREAKR